MTDAKEQRNFISHPLIAPGRIDERAYQVNISKSAAEGSTLVVLPTGMGKTVIALMVIADRLSKKDGKILFLAPTKPLVEQHASFLREFLLSGPVDVFTGETPPEERALAWKSAKIIASTPQVISNDIISGKIDLREVTMIVFDEAHRATGNYAYVFIAEKFKETGGLTLGMTASPGSNAKEILEVCETLGITRVEIRSEYDDDVMPYVQDVAIKWIRVDMPEQVRQISQALRRALVRQLRVLQSFGLMRKSDRVSTKEILEVQGRIQGRLRSSKGKPSHSLFHAASVQACAMAINHALELAETQGISALQSYFDRMKEKASSKGASKASKMALNDPDMKEAMSIAGSVDFEHPKLARVLDVISEQFGNKKDSRAIVFTHYRDTSELVTSALSMVDGIKPVKFVGQASKGADKGLKQKQQIEIIQKFREGEFNVLVATSVGEEGLDIPQTDLVLFYEPVPSEIRTIQRRGRTGRKMPGKVVILITRATRDEAYYWSSRNKEYSMKRELEKLRDELSSKVIVGKPKPVDWFDYEEPPKHEESEEFDEIVIDIEDGKPSPKSQDVPTIAPDAAGKKEEEKAEQSSNGSIEKESLEPIEQPPEEVASKVPSEQSNDDSQVSVSESTVEAVKALLSRRPKQSSLVDFAGAEHKEKVVVDNREFNSEVVKELSRANLIVVPEQLSIGDYLISDRVVVERKTVPDLVKSIMDGRLFQQAKDLKSAYIRPVIVVEGEGLFTSSRMSQESIRGAISSLLLDYGIPVVSTSNAGETADMIVAFVKRERAEGRAPALRPEKGGMGLHDRQQYIVEGLPNVSGTLAQRLLSHFGTVARIMAASEDELASVKGIGKKTAKEIYDTLRTQWLS